jgi:cytochrome c oxidase subunit 2
MWDMNGADEFVLWIVGVFATASLLILALLIRALLRRNLKWELPSLPARPAFREFFPVLAPIVIFALVAIPSLRLITIRNTVPPADLTISMTGNMWFWTYEYPDHGSIRFEAPMLTDAAGPAGTPPSPAWDPAHDHIVVPVGKVVRIVAQPSAVIYSWTLPTLGAKIRSLPDRVSQSWFSASKEGRHYGQCFELCGLPHNFRPIEVEVVSVERFAQWVAETRTRYAAADSPGSPGFSTATD